MIILLFCICGVSFGAFVGIAWWSIDALLGTQTLTVDKAMAMVGLGTVGSAAVIGAIMLIDDWRPRP